MRAASWSLSVGRSRRTGWLPQGGEYADDARATFYNALAAGRLDHSAISAMIQHLFVQHEFDECRQIFKAAAASIGLPRNLRGSNTFSFGRYDALWGGVGGERHRGTDVYVCGARPPHRRMC